jgi:hypothetical protein
MGMWSSAIQWAVDAPQTIQKCAIAFALSALCFWRRFIASVLKR